LHTVTLKNLKYDQEAFDWKDMAFSNAAGQEDKALASKFNSRAQWEDAMRDKTQNLFADIDPTNNSRSMDKLDAIAEKVFEKVKRVVTTYNPVPLMYDVRRGQLGKTLEAHEIQGGRVYNRTYGGFMNISQLKHVTYTITSRPAAVHFQLPIEQLKTGRYSVSDLVFAASQAIIRYKTALAYDTYVSAYTTGSTGYVTNAGGVAISKTVIDNAIDSLADFDVSSITVFGRYSKLTPITDFTGYADVALEEMRKSGVIGKYRGASVLRVKYDVDEVYGTEAFQDTSLFLLSNEKYFNRYVEVEPLTRNQWIDPADKTMHMTFSFEDGAAIWKLKYGHRIYSVG